MQWRRLACGCLSASNLLTALSMFRLDGFWDIRSRTADPNCCAVSTLREARCRFASRRFHARGRRGAWMVSRILARGCWAWMSVSATFAAVAARYL